MARELVQSAFTEATTRITLARACTQVDLSEDGAELLRLGENAIYGLNGSPVVVRIARSLGSLDDVRKEMRVSRWLEAQSFPAARLAEQSGDDALVADGYPVTFWRLIRTTSPRPSEAELGAVLRRLHGLEVPDVVRLPPFSPFHRVEHRLDHPPEAVATEDVAFLRKRFEDLQERYRDLDYHFPPGPVHGDAHLANLMRDGSGSVVLIDFEAFSYGPREWDLSIAGMRHQSFGWLVESDYQTFVDAYGFDILSWSGFPLFRDIRELTMTTWLMQLLDDESAADEFRRRVSDLRSGTYPRSWRAF